MSPINLTPTDWSNAQHIGETLLVLGGIIAAMWTKAQGNKPPPTSTGVMAPPPSAPAIKTSDKYDVILEFVMQELDDAREETRRAKSDAKQTLAKYVKIQTAFRKYVQQQTEEHPGEPIHQEDIDLLHEFGIEVVQHVQSAIAHSQQAEDHLTETKHVIEDLPKDGKSIWEDQ